MMVSRQENHMPNILELISSLIDKEGGFVDHPADRGGPTNWGITEAIARKNGYHGDMRRFTRTDAERIYCSLYWERTHFDKIAPLADHIAGELFDAGVNMGPVVATRFLQRALNALNRNGRDYPDVVLDGLIGPATISALEGYINKRGSKGEAVLLKAMQALRGERYIALTESRPANEAFAYGWLANRIA